MLYFLFYFNNSIHALKNIGPQEYSAIIYENKHSTKVTKNGGGPPVNHDIDMTKVMENVQFINDKDKDL